MVRIMAAFAAWATGTAIATGITWYGANVVLRDSGVGPGMPVVNAAVLPSARPAVPTGPPGPPAPSASALASASPGPASVGPSFLPATSPSGPAGASSWPASASAGPAPAGASSGPAGASASATAGNAHAYTLTGGRVTLEVTPTSVQLVTAVPDPGYAVTTWSGTDWLRVDFSSGPQVSSLIASWYLHAPTITIEN